MWASCKASAEQGALLKTFDLPQQQSCLIMYLINVLNFKKWFSKFLFVCEIFLINDDTAIHYNVQYGTKMRFIQLIKD